jgi:error-prone DNA polymerase
VAEIRKDELALLAEVGALNTLDAHHRRDGLWKATRAGRPVGPLLEQVPESTPESPLLPMNREERLHADYRGTSLTIGPHPMAFHRDKMQRLGVTCAVDLTKIPSGGWTKVAGNAVVKQRPGTAKGIVFISLEDEAGISNVVVMPDMFTSHRLTVLETSWFLFEGPLQNVDGVIHVLAKKIHTLSFSPIASVSHDFH